MDAAGICASGWWRWRRGSCTEEVPHQYEKSAIEPLVKYEATQTHHKAWQNMATVGPYVEWQFQTWPAAWKCWSSESPEWGELAEHPELSDVAPESLCCRKRTVPAVG